MNNQPLLSLWYVKVLLVLIMLGVLMSLAAYTKLTLREARYGQYGMTSISVRGEGEVTALPDIGTFSFGVMAEATDASVAQTNSAEKINSVIAYLKESGIEEKDVKTMNYYLNPKYRYENTTCSANSYCPPGNPVIDGYTVSQTIQVKVRDLSQVGNLISGVGERGATDISSLSFTTDDDSNLKAETRAAAIADAQEKAKELANELGVRLVRVTGYYEEDGYTMPYGSGMGGDAMANKSEIAQSPSLPTGENVTRSVVNITYEVE